MNSPSSAFSQLLQPQEVGDGRYRFEVPTGWGQGRATFGGLVVGASVRAALLRFQSEPQLTLRTLSSQLVGAPVPGTCDLEVKVLKKTKNVTTASIELTQNGDLMTHTVVILGAPRAPDAKLPGLTPPTMPDWRTMEPLDMDVPFAPEFSRNLHYRLIDGIPFTEGTPSTQGFIWPRSAGAPLDAAFIAGMVDAWWLAAFVGLPAPRPAVTLSFGLELHGSLAGHDGTTPLFHRGNVTQLSEGYCSESRELWTVEGTLLALNHQTVAIVK